MQEPLHKDAFTLLPAEIQELINSSVAAIIEVEKELYQSNDKLFPQHANEVRLKAQEYFANLHAQFTLAQEVLKQQFAIQEAQNQVFESHASYQVWETTFQNMSKRIETMLFAPHTFEAEKTLQEEMEIPWAFMDRAYQVAGTLFKEKQYQESQAIYRFLRYLNPQVLEYWTQEGAVLEAIEKYQEALEKYAMGLTLEPENPLIYFQMAHCYYMLKEPDSSLRALELCKTYAKEDPSNSSLLQKALEIEQQVKAEVKHGT